MNRGTNLERVVGLREDGGQPDGDVAALHRSIIVKLAAQGFAVPTGAAESDIIGLRGRPVSTLRGANAPAHGPALACGRAHSGLFDMRCSSQWASGCSCRVRRSSWTATACHASSASPPVGPSITNAEVSSYRLSNGVLHNPVNDRRTTKGVFHVAEAGLPVPGDKVPVPLLTFARLLQAAFEAPRELLEVPFTTDWSTPAHTMVSLLLRPLVCPEVPGVRPEKRMEDPLFCAGRARLQPRLRGEHLRQCR